MPGYTIAQKVLSRIAGYPVEVGDLLSVLPDSVLANEMMGMVIIPKIKALGARRIDRDVAERMMTIVDHGGIGTTPMYVGIHQSMRSFCREHRLKLFDVGTGICHLVFAEQGGVFPGYFVLGTDSHTVNAGAYNSLASGTGATVILEMMITGKASYVVPETIRVHLTGRLPKHVYTKDVVLTIIGRFKDRLGSGRVLEYCGEGIDCMSVSARATISNMAAESGSIAAVFPCDDALRRHFETHFPDRTGWQPVEADQHATYVDEIELNLSTLSPVVACPHAPENIRPIEEVNVEVDQVFLGSCTNAKYEDLQIAAEIIRGHQVRTLTLVVPGTHEIYRRASAEGLTQIFLDAGCRLLYPGCHSCFGGPTGLLGPGQRAASTSNRNYIGRMGGDATTEVYLMSPAAAAATAVEGRITHPARVVGRHTSKELP